VGESSEANVARGFRHANEYASRPRVLATA